MHRLFSLPGLGVIVPPSPSGFSDNASRSGNENRQAG
jgi:hypothetical protein